MLRIGGNGMKEEILKLISEQRLNDLRKCLEAINSADLLLKIKF